MLQPRSLLGHKQQPAAGAGLNSSLAELKQKALPLITLHGWSRLWQPVRLPFHAACLRSVSGNYQAVQKDVMWTIVPAFRAVSSSARVFEIHVAKQLYSVLKIEHHT